MPDHHSTSILQEQLAELRAIRVRLEALERERLLVLQGLDAVQTALRTAMAFLPPTTTRARDFPVESHDGQGAGPAPPKHQDQVR